MVPLRLILSRDTEMLMSSPPIAACGGDKDPNSHKQQPKGRCGCSRHTSPSQHLLSKLLLCNTRHARCNCHKPDSRCLPGFAKTAFRYHKTRSSVITPTLCGGSPGGGSHSGSHSGCGGSHFGGGSHPRCGGSHSRCQGSHSRCGARISGSSTTTDQRRGQRRRRRHLRHECQG